jgi:hypothetical protein
MQFFTALILLAPALVNAVPAVSERDTTTNSLATYTYTVPSDYVAANPDTPSVIELDQAQFDEFAAMVPVQVSSTNEITITGAVNLPQFEDNYFEGASTEGFIGKIKCFMCKKGCPLLGEVGGPICGKCSFKRNCEWLIEANECVVALCLTQKKC